MFAFAVHPLTPWQRRAMGVRRAHLRMATGGPAGVEAVGELAHVHLDTREGGVDGLIVGVPDLHHRLAMEQGRALELQRRAAQVAEERGASALGLGSALAVVAGRGRALRERVEIPVTSGQAATAWAASQLALRLSSGDPVGVLGFAGAVGDAVTARLCDRGHEVRVEDTGAKARRRAAGYGARAVGKEALLECSLIVGASTTGPTLRPERLRPGTILIDVALPPTLHPGPLPQGVQVIAGEALALPGRLRAGFWGRLWLLMAGYGRGILYACVAEPVAVSLALAAPSVGRRLPLEQVEAMGQALSALGFEPVVRSRRLLQRPPTRPALPVAEP